MDLTSRIEFAAGLDAVYPMLLDEQYQLEVCRASEAQSYSVRIEGEATISERTLPAPAIATKFTGPTLQVVETVRWRPETAAGTRLADVDITVTGQPVSLVGTITATETAGRTEVVLNGDLTVKIPLIGRKLEQSAAPAMVAGFKTHQQVGNRWLAEHPAS